MPDEVQLLFDGKATAWPRKYAPGGPLAGRLVALSHQILRHTPPGARVLDLGCGTGELARHLAGAGARAVGCDISRPMLQAAAAGSGHRPARWVQVGASWRRLPFAAAAFDAVAASSVLEYTAEPAAVLSELARVMRPGGVAVCTVPDLRHPVRWAEWLARAAGRLAPVRAAGRRWPRWAGYQAYLRASRQRHRNRWWLAAAARAGLTPAGPLAPDPFPGTSRRRWRALRLLVLRRAGPAGAGVPA